MSAAVLADPIRALRCAWWGWCREIGRHRSSCLPCRRGWECRTLNALRFEERHAHEALERARGGVS